jgi:ribonuclease J
MMTTNTPTHHANTMPRRGGRSKNDRKPRGKSFDRMRGKIFRTPGERDFTPDTSSRVATMAPAAQTPIGNKLRITILGGNEEVGRNMTVFEYGQDIVIIDIGLQWPEEDMPGIDYIIPNVSYLKGKEKNIRGVIFTHGHMDHIGAAPILLKKLGYPPIIGRDLTLALIKKKVEDEEPGTTNRLKPIRIARLSDTIRLGQFAAKFFDVEHSIMDAIGIILTTPSGSVIHMGDWTITNEPIEPNPVTYTHLAGLPKPTILMLESLGSLKKGLPPSEREVHENFKNLLKNAPGRVIIGTFSSQIRRIGYILDYAEQLGKKVALEGYSMKTNIEIAKELGYLKIRKDTLITVHDLHRFADHEIVMICTGAQGEANAALSRIVTDNHRFLRLQKNDTVVFSSSIIPGNERSIQRLKDNLYRKCDNVIHTDIMEVHIGGHSTALGMAEVLRQVQPTFFAPVYANHYFLKEAAKIAFRMNFPEQNVFILDNGDALEIEKNRARIVPKQADASYVFVDGLGVGDVSQIVLRDRQVLAEDGMVVVIVQVDRKTGALVGSPDIVSRGFIFMKEHKELIENTRKKVRDVMTDKDPKTQADTDMIKNNIRNELGQFLFQHTERRPMVLPVVIEV